MQDEPHYLARSVAVDGPSHRSNIMVQAGTSFFQVLQHMENRLSQNIFYEILF